MCVVRRVYKVNRVLGSSRVACMFRFTFHFSRDVVTFWLSSNGSGADFESSEEGYGRLDYTERVDVHLSTACVLHASTLCRAYASAYMQLRQLSLPAPGMDRGGGAVSTPAQMEKWTTTTALPLLQQQPEFSTRQPESPLFRPRPPPQVRACAQLSLVGTRNRQRPP